MLEIARPTRDAATRTILPLLVCGALLSCSGNSASDAADASTVANNPATSGGDSAAASSDGASPADGALANEAGEPNGAGGSLDGSSQTAGLSAAAQVARKLGRTHFLIGHGNDLENDHDKDGAYTLGVTMDIHYAYLVGLLGKGGWPDWNQNPTFVDILADSARRHGTVPMYTLYSMRAEGEGRSDVLMRDDYMKAYWDGAKLMFQRLGAFDAPSIVHFEPDYWGFLQVQFKGDPAAVPVRVSMLAPDCAALPNNAIGMGKCLVLLARKYAPKAVIGFHASLWAGTPAEVGAFLSKIGGSEADLVFVETLDRDAGCFEARVPGLCDRPAAGLYWDETNKTSPNFHDHFAAVSAVSKAVGKPLMWWQVPLGVPSTTPGGTADHYRDNRVRYIFSHVDELVEAGGVGVCFGVGAEKQTTIKTDGGQFKTAVTKYYQAPFPL